MSKLKRLMLTVALVGATVALIQPGKQLNARELIIISAGGDFQTAQKEVFFKPFEQESKIKVIDQAWDNNSLGMLRAKVQSGKPDWDVVMVESDFLKTGCDERLFERLDWSKIGPKETYVPAAVTDCGVGTVLYSMIIAYDGDKIANGPKDWKDFFDLQKFSGKRAMRNGARGNLEFALMADGVPTADVYKVLAAPGGVDRAFKKLEAIKPSVIWWKSPAQPTLLIASGEVAMSTIYNGRIYFANKREKKNFKIVWNQNLLATDYWVILKGSQNLKEAYEFLKFAGQPKVQARFPEFIPNGMSNKAVSSAVNPELMPHLPTNPVYLANALPQNAAFWVENGEKLSDRFDKWVARQ